jgi:hypothetical protein
MLNEIQALFRFVQQQQIWKLIVGAVGIVSTILTIRSIVTFPWPIAIGFVVMAAAATITWYLLWRRRPAEVAPRVVSRFTSSPHHVLFVYGSLLSRDSILRTIAQGPGELECIPCRLRSYKQEWGALRQYTELLHANGRPFTEAGRWASVVTVKGDHTDFVAGALIGLSTEDYSALKARETNYRLRDITDCIEPTDGKAILPEKPIETFLPKSDVTLEADHPNRPVFIRQTLFASLGKALRSLGFKPPKLPPGAELRDAYFVSELVEPRLRSAKGQHLLAEVQQKVSHYMEVHNEYRTTAYALRPLILPRPLFEKAAHIAETSIAISVKALKVVQQNEAVARWAGFSDEDIAFLKCGAGRDELAPKVCRVDMTLFGGRFHVFECNTDSPGGMRHLDIVAARQADALRQSDEFGWVDGQPYATGERTIEALLKSCSSPHPGGFAAVVEYRPDRWPTYPEMQYFVRELKRRDMHAELVDLAADTLEFKNGKLRLSSTGREIDLVYKRILWLDAKKANPKTAAAMAEAYLSGAASFVNSLAGRLAGQKMLLAMMKAEPFRTWVEACGDTLTEAEAEVIRENIPKTWIWGDTFDSGAWPQDSNLRQMVNEEPERYVLKWFHGYGGRKIVLGNSVSRPDLEFDDAWNKGYICQEYIPHGREIIPVCRNTEIVQQYHFFNLGAYVIDGKCVAIEAKTSPKLPIGMAQGAYRTAVFPTVAA